jgi:hypothetical protein
LLKQVQSHHERRLKMNGDQPPRQWHELLLQSSGEILASGEYQNEFPPEVVVSRWLGFEGAKNEQIASAERRLGATLPPSYREFLKITNGWRRISPFIYKLWSVQEIDWFRTRHQQDWIEPWTLGSRTFGAVETVPDNKYFIYGKEQDPAWIREEYLSTALEISDVGDSAIYLLNPRVVTPDGEWEAWFFASWLPGANRYPSFWDLMQAELQSLLSSREQ